MNLLSATFFFDKMQLYAGMRGSVIARREGEQNFRQKKIMQSSFCMISEIV
jgi:hypothetical protein